MHLVQFMMDNGLMIKHQTKEKLFIRTKTSMKATS